MYSFIYLKKNARIKENFKRKEKYMEIKIVSDVKNQECDILMVNMFEGQRTSNEIANEYAIDEDNFEGKFNTTYLLPTYGKNPARKVLVVGLGKESDLDNNKIREAMAKAVKKAREAAIISYVFD